MVIASLALDRLDDDGTNIDVALLDKVEDLALGLLFTLDHVRLALRFRQREIDGRTGDARPIKFRKQIRFARIGIGQAHRVTAPAMKCVTEMKNLRAARARAASHVLPSRISWPERLHD